MKAVKTGQTGCLYSLITAFASHLYVMGLDVRKPGFGVCEQQRRRPVQQSDQRFCYLLI